MACRLHFLSCPVLLPSCFEKLASLSWLSTGAVFTKGLNQVLGLTWLYFYTKVKPKTWLRPFVNTAPELHLRTVRQL